MSEPIVTLEQFFAAARDGRLTAIRCGGCGELAIPPKEFCPACGRRAWSATTLSGDGTVASFTIIRVAPHAHAKDAPYAIVAVRLEEGVSLLGRLLDVPLDAIRVGMPVRFRPLVHNGTTALAFVPVSTTLTAPARDSQ